MPKTPARDDYFAQSFGFTPKQAATLKQQAKRLGSTTAFIRELIDDQRTMFGLPRSITRAALRMNLPNR